jgi:uncharacterized iron-regulated membrane protein
MLRFSPSLQRKLYRLHSWIGLFVAVHAVVLFLSGALLLFRDEIEQSFAPEQAALSARELTSKDFVAAEKMARDLFPNDRILSVAADENSPNLIQIRMGIDGAKNFRGARRLAYDSLTGSQAIEVKRSGFFEWLLELHRDLLMGSKGKLYVAFVGLLYLFTLVSGFVIYGGFMKKKAFSEMRRQSPRALYADLHKYLGVATFAWAFLIGATGVFLALNSTLLKIYQATELRTITQSLQRSDVREADASSFESALAKLATLKATAALDFVAFPDTEFAPAGSFLILIKGTGRFDERLSELAILSTDANGGGEIRSLPGYLKALMLSEPLHFGDYGGLPLKIVWLILTLMTLMLPLTGIYVWVKRKFLNRELTPKYELRKQISWPLAFQRPYLLPTVVSCSLAAGIGWVFIASETLNFLGSLFSFLVVIGLLFLGFRSFLGRDGAVK